MIEIISIRRGSIPELLKNGVIIETVKDPTDLSTIPNGKLRVLMDGDSFEALMTDHQNEQDRINDAKIYAEKKIQEIQEEYSEYYRQCRSQMDQKYWNGYSDAESRYKSIIKEKESEIAGLVEQLTTLKQENTKLEHDYTIQSDLNDSYRRIQIERMNAARGLTPKKEHPGFVILSMEQWVERINTEDYYTALQVWKTVIQTPYDAKIKYEYQEADVLEDLKNKVFPLLGDAIWMFRPEDNGNQDRLLEVIDDDFNHIYRWAAKADLQKGLWQLTLFSTQQFDDIPDFLLSSPKSGNGKKDRK